MRSAFAKHTTSTSEHRAPYPAGSKGLCCISPLVGVPVNLYADICHLNAGVFHSFAGVSDGAIYPSPVCCFQSHWSCGIRCYA